MNFYGNHIFAAFMLALAPLLASASEPLYLCPDGLGPFRPQKGADFCLPTLTSEGGVALPEPSDIYFDRNSAELSPQATAILNRLVPIFASTRRS